MEKKNEVLYVWDFDDTIIRTPGPEAFKELFEQGVLDMDEINRDRNTFWNNPVSLDTDFFQLVCIQPAVDFYEEAKDMGEHVMITSRTSQSFGGMKNILGILGMDMPILSGTDYGSKIKALNAYISVMRKKMPGDWLANLKLVFIEDSVYNLHDYDRYCKNRGLSNTMIIVNTHAMSTISGKLPEFVDRMDTRMEIINTNV